MLLNDASDIRIGTRKVLKVYVGGTQVWPRGVKKYFRFKKKVVWLTPTNGFRTTNEVDSNTNWKIE